MSPQIRILVAALLCLAGIQFAQAQKRSTRPQPILEQQPGGPPVLISPDSNKPDDEAHARLEKEMAKKANQDRQAALKRDTDRLLALATELKQYVDKSSENTLSLNVIKKADEIEKLAHSVKDKMRGNN